jgi:D-tyrosyl-tRNA(Tyr) deacylase
LRALLQRVSRAEVRVDGRSLGSIEGGLLILLGVAPSDDDAVAAALAAKIVGLRIFADEAGLTNLSIGDVGGAVLVVSQFTLFADARKGRRPSFLGAAGPELGERLYDSFCESLAASGVPVERGRFGADMDVELVNAGPFTIWLDTVDLGIAARPGS